MDIIIVFSLYVIKILREKHVLRKYLLSSFILLKVRCYCWVHVIFLFDGMLPFSKHKSSWNVYGELKVWLGFWIWISCKAARFKPWHIGSASLFILISWFKARVRVWKISGRLFYEIPLTAIWNRFSKKIDNQT